MTDRRRALADINDENEEIRPVRKRRRRRRPRFRIIYDDGSDEDPPTRQHEDLNSLLAEIPPVQQAGTFSFESFRTMWLSAESNMNLRTEQIENSAMVRQGNDRMDFPDDTQANAQYGRLLPHGVQKLFDITGLVPTMTFLDIGHGIGNVSLQAAFVIGCEARGIEVINSRHTVAEIFKLDLETQLKVIEERDRKQHQVGRVSLRHGSLTDPAQETFLTHGVDVIFVNNAFGVFGERSCRQGRHSLHAHIARLFALSQPFTKMVTLDPIYEVGSDLGETNSIRARRQLPMSTTSSYFTLEVKVLGTQVVSWSDLEVKVYIYTRTFQENVDQSQGASFLCCNPACKLAQHVVAIPVVRSREDGLLTDECPLCEQGRPKASRRRRG